MKLTTKSIFSTIFFLLSPIALGDSMIQVAQPTGSSPHDLYIRNFTCYIFGGIMDSTYERCQTAATVSADTSKIPETTREQLIESKITGTDFIDLPAIRVWWETWAYPLRKLRHQDQLMSDSLSDFARATNFRSWPKEIIHRSSVKQKTRVIYRSPETFAHSLSVAETYDSTTGDLESPVIETEIALDRDDASGNADFYSYNSAGQLSTTSRFPSGEKTAPTICMSCHYQPSTGVFSRDRF